MIAYLIILNFLSCVGICVIFVTATNIPQRVIPVSSNPIRGVHLDDISAKTLLRQLPEYTSFTLQYRLTHCMRATDGLEWIPVVFTTGLHALENSLIFSWVSSLARALDPLRPQKALVLCVCHLENAWLKHNINWNEFNKLIFDLEKLKTKG